LTRAEFGKRQAGLCFDLLEESLTRPI
jgi:hypothetical protein